MTFQPTVPFSGAAGWEFLQRTRERQQQAFEESPTLKRNTDAFLERIGSIGSAEELVADRELLQVALGAFGLDEDLDNKYLITKVLESDTASPKSLTSRFADKRYEEFSEAFGFGSQFGPNTNDPGFAENIVSAYNDRQFEIAIGEQSADMRLAMTVERDLAALVEKSNLSGDAAWFSVMSNPPLRTVFETALGLPASFGTLDIDQQLVIFRERSGSMLNAGEIADFSDISKVEELRRLFLVRSQINETAVSFSPASIALKIIS